MSCIGILGYGQVGQALETIYRESRYYDDIRIKDINSDSGLYGSDVLDICIPYTDSFNDTVCEVIKEYGPLLTIINSSVPPGTTKAIQDRSSGSYVVHSPVRGVHPVLADSLRTFIKYIGSDTDIGHELAEKHYNANNIRSERLSSSRATELAKLLCTTYYGMCIAWHEEMNKLCLEHGVEFDAISHWNSTYNDGYTKMDMYNVVRPILYPPKGKIGGHCVIPNAELLSEFTNSKVLDIILDLK